MTHDGAPPRFPEPSPERLRARVANLLHASDAGGSAGPEALLRVAHQAIRGVLDAGARDRAAALDVLAADALVTHAIELIAGSAEEFEVRCNHTLQQLAAIAPHT